MLQFHSPWKAGGVVVAGDGSVALRAGKLFVGASFGAAGIVGSFGTLVGVGFPMTSLFPGAAARSRIDPALEGERTLTC
jgi:hypothetical protein